MKDETEIEMIRDEMVKNDPFTVIGARLRLRELEVRADILAHPSKYMNRVEPVPLEGEDVVQLKRKYRGRGGRPQTQYYVNDEWISVPNIVKKYKISDSLFYKLLGEDKTPTEAVNFKKLSEQNNVSPPII